MHTHRLVGALVASVMLVTATSTVQASTVATGSQPHYAGMMASCDPANIVLTERITSINGGTAVEATFQNKNDARTCSLQKVGLASYQRLAGDTADTSGPVNAVYNQMLFKSATADLDPQTSVTLRVDVPSCSYQADAFYGPVIEKLIFTSSLYGTRKLDYAFGNKAISCDIPVSTPTPPGTNTPELGSGELLFAGLLPVLALGYVARRRARRSN